MADEYFTDFSDNKTPASGDFAVGYNAAASDEQRYTLKAISGLISNARQGSGDSPLTTKGDIWGFSSVDARIPVGSAGDVLIADNGEALGVRWGTTGGGGFWSANTNKIYYNVDNVGLGITNPTVTLEATGTVSGAIGQFSFVSGVTGRVSTLYVDGTGVTADRLTVPPLTSQGDIYGHNATVKARIPVGTNNDVLIADDGEALGVRWGTTGGGGFWSANANKIYYNTDYVGIGTTTPEAPLHVVGNSIISGGHTRLLSPTFSWAQGFYPSDKSFRISFSGTSGATLGTNDLLTLSTGAQLGVGAGTITDFLVSGGQVGIGLGSILPTSPLQVSGAVDYAVATFEGFTTTRGHALPGTPPVGKGYNLGSTVFPWATGHFSSGVDIGTGTSPIFVVSGGQVGIGDYPRPDLALDVSSGDRRGGNLGAFCPPKLTTTERNALTATEGMLIYNTTTNALNIYDGSWSALSTS